MASAPATSPASLPDEIPQDKDGDVFLYEIVYSMIRYKWWTAVALNAVCNTIKLATEHLNILSDMEGMIACTGK